MYILVQQLIFKDQSIIRSIFTFCLHLQTSFWKHSEAWDFECHILSLRGSYRHCTSRLKCLRLKATISCFHKDMFRRYFYIPFQISLLPAYYTKVTRILVYGDYTFHTVRMLRLFCLQAIPMCPNINSGLNQSAMKMPDKSLLTEFESQVCVKIPHPHNLAKVFLKNF